MNASQSSSSSQLAANNSVALPTTTPATWLGVMGGGQLGRMFAHAAQAMGFKVAVLEQELDCPAGQVADRLIRTAYTDAEGLAQLGSLCSAVTTEFENVSAQSLATLAAKTYVAPAANGVSIAQDRIAEKRFFVESSSASGVHPAPHKTIASDADIAAITEDLLPGILKTVRMGYDGKGQVRVRSVDEVRAAFADMGGVICLLEKMLPLAYEVSVLVARGADGAAVVYPIAENVHRDGILFTTTVPSDHVAPSVAKQAQDAALSLISRLDYVGVLCIEFFVLKDGSLVVNEMAPRPHNSGHYTIDACITSQFEQQVRAMARLPLGDVRQHSPAVMLNILGDVWYPENGAEVREPDWDKILALPGAHLHLYGKAEARRGRKMGHITFVAPTLAEAQAQLSIACQILGIAG
ncbi:5-(carboxyamino)imidazole ribonucleotide synthase [Herbaspirillum sp. Sphag1AN]|uniref:5-(carboxyamino)imidazole ribonucleotide synthase n=1 Tax=unclassified Herbaspirillum TaxID=2624150 RepID=UPI00161891B5|nr:MULTISPECIES: 5-(carboxyamino)imidazole ribonucleotide synthase [unclassified Herbaspirillum]MBB3214659.1 5-(carboxyamino)imidazole ribonucleotide synthase [Herbaspirillum sp. Sphag1AN]MBB3247855.1 5-(carboxyamino)imidazole ribonucleotide synthase [Herbaspirillum sp. Sphag64]